MMALIATAFAAVYVLLGDQVIRLFLNGENTQALSVGKQFCAWWRPSTMR